MIYGGETESPDFYIERSVCDSFSLFIAKLSKSRKCIIIPGLIDVHVHLREPGFFYKETIESGTKAAARGGYTALCSMPNLNPAPDCLENLMLQLSIIEKSAAVRVLPYGTITKGQKGEILSDMEEMAAYVAGFSDDGRGVQSEDIMRLAMKKAKASGKIISAHCEDNSLICGGYIHDGEYAKRHSHKGISSESEWRQIERDLRLARQTGVSYHVCHVSTKESVALLRRAKREGLDVTCETAPHYLLLCDTDLREDGRFKMNPPLRGEADREALLEGIADGTIDMIATDHAPHSEEEKSKGLKDSLMGVTGLESAFPVLYTGLVEKGIISLPKLLELMCVNPGRRFGITCGSDFAVFAIDREYRIDPASFLSKGKSTPFEGMSVSAECLMTVCNGKIVWQKEEI